MDMEHADQLSVADAFDIAGQVAVITGAANGIGRATARILANAGVSVVLGDIDEPGVKAVADEIAGRGGAAVPVQMDVKVKDEIDGLVARAVSEFGRIDIMGNIAGIMHRGLIVDLSDEEFDFIWQTNLRGVLWGSQAAARAMIPQGSGNIINIASGAIDGPAPTLAGYAMSKAGVAMLTKTCGTEGAPYNIRVNAIAPGIILSNFSRPHFVDEQGEVDQERFQAYEAWASAAAPLGRVGLPSDVAWTILYLVSDAANFVTGQILRPNGGNAMPW